MRVAWPRGGACSSASGRLPTAPPAAAAATRRAAAAGPGPASSGVRPCRRSKRTAVVHTRAWRHRQHSQIVGVVMGGAGQQTWRATLHRHKGRHQAADICSGPHAWIPRRAIRGNRLLFSPAAACTAVVAGTGSGTSVPTSSPAISISGVLSLVLADGPFLWRLAASPRPRCGFRTRLPCLGTRRTPTCIAIHVGHVYRHSGHHQLCYKSAVALPHGTHPRPLWRSTPLHAPPPRRRWARPRHRRTLCSLP